MSTSPFEIFLAVFVAILAAAGVLARRRRLAEEQRTRARVHAKQRQHYEDAGRPLPDWLKRD